MQTAPQKFITLKNCRMSKRTFTKIQLNLFALQKSPIDYVMSLTSRNQPYITEKIIVKDASIVPVDKLLTNFEALKKLRDQSVALLGKFERHMNEHNECQNGVYDYIIQSKSTLYASFNTTSTPWLNVIQDQLKIIHECPTLPLKYATFAGDFERLSQKYTQALNTFSGVDTELSNLIKTKNASLTTCSLSGIVNSTNLDDYFETEYLKCMVVVVPKSSVPEFTKTYCDVAKDRDKLKAGVVPESARQLAEDENNVMYSVVVFKPDYPIIVADYRERKYTVREFIHEDASNSVEERIEVLKRMRLERLNALSQFVEENITYCLQMCVEIQIFTCYNEAVLRYGKDFDTIALVSENLPPKVFKNIMAKTFRELLQSCDRNVYDTDFETEGGFLPFVMITSTMADQALTR